MYKAGKVFVDFYTGLGQGTIVGLCQSVCGNVISNTGQDHTYIYATLGGVFQRVFHFCIDDEIGRHDINIVLCPIEDIDVTVRFPNIYRKCLEEGYDITKEWIPVVPAQHYFMGGVQVDSDSHTSMEHLYAAGETSCNGVHGRNRLASNSLLESLVFAKKAALHIVNEGDKNADRFVEQLTKSLEELASVYELSLEEYKNLDTYYRNNKKMIRQEIGLER